MDIDFGLQVGVDPVASSNQKNRADRRMVADLLSIDGAAIDESLEGFSEDGVEWFFHIKVENRIGECECNTIFELLELVIGSDCSPFK